MRNLLRHLLWPVALIVALGLTFAAASALGQETVKHPPVLQGGTTDYVTTANFTMTQPVPRIWITLVPEPGGGLSIKEPDGTIICAVEKDGRITGDAVRALRMMAAVMATMRVYAK